MFERTLSEDSVRAVITAISWPRAGMFPLLPTAMIVAARVSCCWLRVTVSPLAFTALMASGTGPDTPTLPAAASSQRHPPEPAAAGLISVATPRTAVPGASSTAAAAPATSTFMPTARSPQRVVELREPKDVAPVERRLAGDEDGERDRIRRLGRLAVPDATAVPGSGDRHSCCPGS